MEISCRAARTDDRMSGILEAVENGLDEGWLLIYRLCHGDEFTLNVTVPFIIILTVYWVFSIFFIFVDVFGWPAWVARYKIPDANQEKYPKLTPAGLRKIVAKVLINQTLVAFPVIYLCYVARRCLGYDNGLRFPKLPHLIFDIAFQILVEEILFYYVHRFFHLPQFYKKYHKDHHSYVFPVGVTTSYGHPVEHVFSSVIPPFAGSVVLGTHVTSLWIWLIIETAASIIIHCGYHLPLSLSPEFHHYHHLTFNENFGLLGMLDWLHGTDKNYRKSHTYARDKVLLSLTPLK